MVSLDGIGETSNIIPFSMKLKQRKGVSRDVITEINDVKVMTERVTKRKAECSKAALHFASERSRLVTSSWKETEGEPLDIRRAKLFKNIMEANPVAIREGELIVGSQSKYVRGASSGMDFNPKVAQGLLNSKLGSPSGREERATSSITEEERSSLLEDLDYWLGRSPHEAVENAGIEMFGDQWIDFRVARVLTRPHGSPVVGRYPNYVKLLSKGLKGVLAEAKSELKKLTSLSESNDLDKYYFLKAVIITLEAAMKFAQRYAKLAQKMSAKEKDPVRKKELEKIADICKWVPKNPARNFHEAVQFFWFIHLSINLEADCSHEVPGRMDKYLYPFYEKDLAEGRITRQEAAELLGCLWIKFAEMVTVKGKAESEIAETNQGQNMTIGGVDDDGNDASNELTYILLEVARQVKTPQPPINLRVHKNTPEELWIKAAEVNRDRGDGVPAYLNDEAEVPYLVSRGMPIQEARDWVGTGCVYAMGTGFVPDRHITVNHAKVFEITLNNGVDPYTGKQLGIKTGDPRKFSSFDELYSAFKKQGDYFISVLANFHRLYWQARNRCYSLPFNSALLDDCIKKGKNFFAGGIRYPQLYWGLKDRGHQNVADSLAAIKKLVFEEKKLTMPRLLKALKANFKGKENIKIQQMLKSAPKYGNDDDYVDDIFNDLSLWAQRRIVQEKHANGAKMRSGRGGATTHAYLGKTIGALPDGREAWVPLADGSLSPMRGVDIKGPTAAINSATKVNHTEEAGYTLFNMKVTPSVFKSTGGLAKLNALTKTHFDRGAYHIQYNLMGTETLRKAQNNPDQYRDLLVRVAGYSAYFVDLSLSVQDEIIARNEYSL